MNGLNPSFIWEEHLNLEYKPRFEKSTLTFQLFNFKSSINETFSKFIQFLEPFITHYPWYIKQPSTDIFRYKDYEYIYGELVYDENINDEWLLVYLIWEYSKIDSDVFIHVGDSLDGEFLLVQAFDEIDDWMQPTNSLNRPWINNGNLVIVDENSHDYLNLEDSINELRRMNYRFHQKITSYFNNKWLKESNSYYLDLIYDFNLELPKSIIKIFSKKPWLISRSINEFKVEQLSINQNLKVINGNEKEVITEIGIPFLSLSETKEQEYMLARDQGIEIKFESLLKKMLIIGLDVLLQSDQRLINGINLESSEIPSVSRNVIQNKLISLKRLSRAISSNSNEWNNLQEFDPSVGNTGDELNEQLIEQFNQFFSDQEAGLEGINNDPEEHNESTTDEEPSKFMIECINELGDEFSDFIDYCIENEFDIRDTDARNNYYNKYNQSSKRPKRKKITGQLKNYNDDSDYQTDTSTEYLNEASESFEDDFKFRELLKKEDKYEAENTKNDSESSDNESDSVEDDARLKKILHESNDVDSLTNLFKSINTEVIGPGSILLEQGIKNAK